MATVTLHKLCRICGSTKLTPVLDLGSMPLANAFLTKKELNRPEASFPLVVQFCDRCSLLSLRHTVDPSTLFRGYHYVTAASFPLVAHFKEEARMILERFITRKDQLIVEFGSNDGVLLSELKSACRVLGVDPARIVGKFAQERGVETIQAFFGERTAARIKKGYGKADILIANNVFAHIDDLHDTMRGVEGLLADDGVFISESHWVGNLIGDGGFDQIYHEHLSYYSLHALQALASLHGLIITEAQLIPIHGVSMRVFMRKKGRPKASVTTLLAREKRLGLTTIRAFRAFGKRVLKNKTAAAKLLRRLASFGATIVGYGAPAKGNTLLNYFGIGPDILSCITDTTSLKQGLFTPGTHIPVVSPHILTKQPPEYLLLLAWNYADAILKKEQKLREQGVKFIIPVPTVSVV